MALKPGSLSTPKRIFHSPICPASPHAQSSPPRHARRLASHEPLPRAKRCHKQNLQAINLHTESSQKNELALAPTHIQDWERLGTARAPPRDNSKPKPLFSHQRPHATRSNPSSCLEKKGVLFTSMSCSKHGLNIS